MIGYDTDPVNNDGFVLVDTNALIE
jgi:hypothetical protein